MADLATVDGGKAANDENSELRQRVKDLRTKVEDGYWELSQALREVYDESAYIAWGYETWAEYVESGELDFQVRKAQYLVAIATWFGKLPKGVQKWIAALGWSKAKELVNRVTAENAAEWKKKVAGKTVAQIKAMLESEKEDKGGGDGDGGGDGEGSTSEKATRWAFQLFPAQRENVEAALGLASKSSQSDKEGNNLDLICTEYMATNAAIGDANEYLSKVEKTLGVKLIAYQESTEAIVFGQGLLDTLYDDPEGEPEGESKGEGDG